MLAEVIGQWPWKLQASEPEAGTGVRRQDRRGRARRQREALSDLGGTERLVARAQLHVPESIRIAALRRGREVERERGAVGARCAHRGGERRRRVHDEQVARLQEPRQLAEARVDDVVDVAGHEQAHVVACSSTGLGGRVRLEPRR